MSLSAKPSKPLRGLDYYALDTIWLNQGEVPAHLSARAMLTNLGMLLDLRSKEVASLLGVSESRISRNDQVTLAMLDRAKGSATPSLRSPLYSASSTHVTGSNHLIRL